MDIEFIKSLCKDETIEVTNHFAQRRIKRNITYEETKEAILNGEIIEHYPDDFPFESCLILGTTLKDKYLHIVVGIGENKLWIVTAYEPDIREWDSTLKVRKEH